MPVLISEIRGMKSRDKRIGGAALEYRLVYRQTPRLGDRLILRSGLKALGSKTFGWGHWLFDANSGACVAGAESVAVMLDLIARKAIAIPENERPSPHRTQRRVPSSAQGSQDADAIMVGAPSRGTG